MDAAIYCRISADKVGAGLGVARQEKDCRALAKRLGWTVVAVYGDNDISAYSGKRRPNYEQMLDAVRDGTVGAIIAWHTDRLHRSPTELEKFIDVCESRRPPVGVHTVTGGPLDLSTPAGRMAARIHGAVARHESEHKGERLRAKHAELAQAGRPSGGGPRPYGYAADGMTVVPAEAKVLREVARRLLAGESLRGVAMRLNARGVTTSTGGKWLASTVRQVMLRPRIAGLREHLGQVVGPAAWKPIVPREQWETVRTLLTDSSRHHGGNKPGAVRTNLLAGLMTCGVCGGRMVAGYGVHDGKVYRCSRFACTSRKMDHVDAWVTEVVLALLDRPDIRARLDPPKDAGAGAELAAEVDALRVKRAAYLDAADTFAPADLRRLLGKLDARLTESERRLVGTLSATPPLGVDPRATWGRLDLHQKRAVIGALVEVTVLRAPRGNRFSTAHVVVRPR